MHSISAPSNPLRSGVSAARFGPSRVPGNIVKHGPVSTMDCLAPFRRWRVDGWVDVNSRYDAVAEDYASVPIDVTRPVTAALLELCEVTAGDFVLDLACGHGTVAREIARFGATVIGMDISERLLEHARSLDLPGGHAVAYAHGDAASAVGFGADEFDLIVCNFGLSDIDDLDGVLYNVRRALRPAGRFVFSILHPCFAGADNVSGSWATHGTYYDEVSWRADGELSTLRHRVGANHRMLSTYVNTLHQHGLSIDVIKDPRPEESWTIDRPVAARQPVYLVIRCLNTAT
jgi:ubiquinone/menaquinone biosynthesis C-methylase UbiE